MGKRDEALALLQAGMSPGMIRKWRKVSLKTILGYLDEMVGRGKLRRSDILFSIPAEDRGPISAVLSETQDTYEIISRLKSQGYDPNQDDVEVVVRYSDARFAFGDMYDEIRTIEVALHNVVRNALKKAFGDADQLWWHQIPEAIRKDCVSRKEEDAPISLEPFCYVNLIDLKTIIDRKWNVIAKALPDNLQGDKPDFLKRLLRLNNIRKKIMHPVRGESPSEDDFDFLRSLREDIAREPDAFKCGECDAPVSPDALSCPKCGVEFDD